jgi:hypothetical protein
MTSPTGDIDAVIATARGIAGGELTNADTAQLAQALELLALDVERARRQTRVDLFALATRVDDLLAAVARLTESVTFAPVIDLPRGVGSPTTVVVDSLKDHRRRTGK